MKTTPNYGWSYPEPADHTRTWEYWQSLATQIDTTLKAQLPMIRTGPFSIPITTTVASASAPINFGTAFPAGVIPVVLLQSNNTASTGWRWQFRISGNPTNLGFTAFVCTADGANFTGGNTPSGSYIALALPT